MERDLKSVGLRKEDRGEMEKADPSGQPITVGRLGLKHREGEK